MAPPSARRTGFSRRAQYGLFIGYVIAVAGVLFAVLLLIIAAIDPRGFAALKGAALDATSPVTRGGGGVSSAVGGATGSIGDYFRAGSQNAQLRADLATARQQLVATQAIRFENQRLRQLLGVAQEVPDEVTVARLVGSSFGSARRTATLSAGSASGVQIGMPVRAPDGIIGRVLETGRWASRVLLVTDGASTVPVRLVRDGTPALAVGRGDGTIELRTLEVGANPFRLGDILVSSGIGGIFPPNVPVARVVSIQRDITIARPTADPARADFAVVQRIYQPAAEAPLDQAPPVQRAPVTVAAPPPPPGQGQPATPAARQQSPAYQPALQRPQATATPPSGAPAQPAPALAQPAPQGQRR